MREVRLTALEDMRILCDGYKEFNIAKGDIVVLPYDTESMQRMVAELISDGVCELDTSDSYDVYKEYTGTNE